MIHIFSVNGLINIKKDTEGIIISKNVGLKNRLQILKRAKELNISVLNLNADEHIKKIEEFISSKKKKTPEAKKEPKPQKEAKSKPKEETKQKEDAELTDKEKKEAEKIDKDKLLTKKV